jgi:preprotein translocase subunit SecG
VSKFVIVIIVLLIAISIVMYLANTRWANSPQAATTPRSIRPRSSGPCLLNGKTYSEGALARGKDGTLRCQDGQWQATIAQ